jgi:TonB family protein
MPAIKVGIAVVIITLTSMGNSMAATKAPVPTFAQATKPKPKRISHYMREAGLTVLESLDGLESAETKYAVGVFSGGSGPMIDQDKELIDLREKSPDHLMAHMKINEQFPGDHHFLTALHLATLGASAVGQCVPAEYGGNKTKEECRESLERYVGCKRWVQDAIDSGIFNDNWNVECMGGEEEYHDVVEGQNPPQSPLLDSPPSVLNDAPNRLPSVRPRTNDTQPILLLRINPKYPPIAKAARIQGTVVMQIAITTSGQVESVRIVSGPPMLQQAAMDAVRAWRFRPNPVEVETTVNLVFDLSSGVTTE